MDTEPEKREGWNKNSTTTTNPIVHSSLAAAAVAIPSCVTEEGVWGRDSAAEFSARGKPVGAARGPYVEMVPVPKTCKDFLPFVKKAQNLKPAHRVERVES